LSEDEGIKAIVGKPKNRDTMEIQSYLFEVSRGWTIDKAKTWFEQHSKNGTLDELVPATVSFRVLEKIVDKPLRFRSWPSTTICVNG
jgi:hypothetical protein